MTEFCPVLPPGLHGLLDVSEPGAWHFVHAPQVVGYRQSANELVRFLGQVRGVVILDCFAFELDGQLPAAQEVYEAATILRGECAELIVVCPDVLRNGESSFRLLRQHGPSLQGYGRLMVVPHGENLAEWMGRAEDCLDFCRNMGVARPYIGLPRYMSGWGRSARYKAAVWLHHYYHVQVHLLGAGQGLAEAQFAASAPNVSSCDSTAPFAYAMKHGIGNLSSLLETKVEMAPDWWNLTIHDLDCETARAAQLNIALWKEALRSVRFAEPYSIG